MLAEIVLPAGTERVYFRDMPDLFAKAAYPDIPENTPRKIVAIRKYPLTEFARNLCGLGRCWLPLDEDDISALERGCWKTLSQIDLRRRPITEEEWQAYEKAFQTEPTTRDWELRGEFQDYSANGVLQVCTAKNWEEKIRLAVDLEQVIPICPGLGREPRASKHRLPDCYLLFREFIDFAALHDFGVQFADGSHEREEPSAPAEPKPENDATQADAAIDSEEAAGQPRTAIGKLAIEAARQIKQETKRAASVKAVMTLLQEWATNGTKPETLIRPALEKRGVMWRTIKGTEKLFDEEACSKCLERWAAPKKAKKADRRQTVGTRGRY
jgi:hypothetical protein